MRLDRDIPDRQESFEYSVARSGVSQTHMKKCQKNGRDNMEILNANLKGKAIANIAVEYPEGLVTEREICCRVLEGTRLYVVWIDQTTCELKAEWKVFDGVYSFIDINDAIFKDETNLPCEEYGKTWLAYCEYSVEEKFKQHIAELKRRKKKG